MDKGIPTSRPNSSRQLRLSTSLSYTIKFIIKKSDGGLDYKVMPLEGLWWTDEKDGFNLQKRSSWKWTLMIMQPDFVSRKIITEALSELEKKKRSAALSKIRSESYLEGKSAQIMHIGHFSAEGPTISCLQTFIKDAGSRPRGRHHEIYLSDFRRVAPEKMKTIIRQPME